MWSFIKICLICIIGFRGEDLNVKVYDGRTPSDSKSLHGLWPGQLKKRWSEGNVWIPIVDAHPFIKTITGFYLKVSIRYNKWLKSTNFSRPGLFDELSNNALHSCNNSIVSGWCFVLVWSKLSYPCKNKQYIIYTTVQFFFPYWPFSLVNNHQTYVTLYINF